MFRLLVAFSFLLSFTNLLVAQDIPVTQEDRNTFSFSTENYIVITDFELLNATPLEKPDTYLLTLRALTPEKETDESVSGYLLFEVAGHPESIEFVKGIANHEAQIQTPQEFTLTAVDSTITKTFQIQEPVHWYWVFLILPALVVFYLIFRKMNGRKK